MGLLVDDPEDVLAGLAQGFPELPAGQRQGDGIEEGNPAFCVAGDDRIADTAERYPQPLALFAQFLFRFLALGNLPLQFRFGGSHGLQVSGHLIEGA